MDRNQNQGNQSWRSDQDWNETRRRFNQRSDLNQGREDYGNTGYGYNQGSSRQSGRGYRENQGDDRYSNREDYRRTSYMPDNDENRYESDRDYEGNQYGTSGTYGYRGSSSMGHQGMDSGTGSYGSGYGSMGEGSNYGRQSNWRERQGMSNYGDYGGGYGRAYGEQYRRMMEGRRGYGDYDRDSDRNRRYAQGQQDRNWWERTRDEVSSWFGDEDAERRRDNDRYNEGGGGYRGKGPKNYHRSEERIKEDVCDRLTDDDMLDASDVDIQVQGHEVILTGRVNNRMQKRRAEDLAESVSGVHNVENRLHVGQSNITTLADSTEGTSGMLTRESREKK